MVVTIAVDKPIPDYDGSKQYKKHNKDVVKEELRHQRMRLKAAKRKNGQLKKQRDNEKTRRKDAERTLEQERSAAAARELKLRLQVKLDDWAFFHDGSRDQREERYEL